MSELLEAGAGLGWQEAERDRSATSQGKGSGEALKQASEEVCLPLETASICITPSDDRHSTVGLKALDKGGLLSSSFQLILPHPPPLPLKLRSGDPAEGGRKAGAPSRPLPTPTPQGSLAGGSLAGGGEAG